VQEVEVIMSRGASDVARQAAGLKQAQVSLKLELGRLTRQDLLMKQKVGQQLWGAGGQLWEEESRVCLHVDIRLQSPAPPGVCTTADLIQL
jgi:hypothetical protein